MKNPGGRPKLLVDYEQLDELCKIQCTAEECASVLKMSVDTLDLRLKEDTGMGFPEYFRQKSAGGKASLRRRQWEKAEANDNTMLIWLGKQYLGQAEKQELTGDAGGPIRFTDTERAARLAALIAKVKERGK